MSSSLIKTRYNKRTAALDVVRQEGLVGKLNGKTMVVTGGNSGIGFETVIALVASGAKVVMCSRSVERGDLAVAEVWKRLAQENIEADSANLTVEQLDLGSFESIRACAKRLGETHEKIDVLVNNAGISMWPYTLTKEGIEANFGVNHVGHFLLTDLLMPQLEKAANETGDCRVVVVSSGSHYTCGPGFGQKLDGVRLLPTDGQYSQYSAYCYSKRCNVMFANELARRCAERQVAITANSLHPAAMVATNIGHQSVLARIGQFLLSPFTRTVPQAAATSTYLAVAPEAKGVGGKYWDEVNEKLPADECNDQLTTGRLWEWTEAMVKRGAPVPLAEMGFE